VSSLALSSKLFSQSALSILAKGGTLALNLALVGVVSRLLTPSEFAPWIYMIYWINVIASLDFGFGALRNGLVGHSDPRRLFFAVFYLFAAISFVGALFLGPFSMALALSCLRIPFALAGCAFYAAQEAGRKALMDFFEAGVMGVFTLIGVALGFPIEGYALGGVCSGAISFGLLARRRRWKGLKLSFEEIKKEIAPHVKLGVEFLFQSLLSSALACALVKIAHVIAPSQITPLLLAHRLFTVVVGGHITFLAPYWSGYTKAYVEGRYEWIRGRLRESLLLSSLLFTGFSLGIIMAHRKILFLWTGVDALFEKEIVLLAVLFTVQGLTNTFSFFLNGLSKVRRQVIAMGISLGLYLAMSLLFGIRWGLIGILWGAIIASIPLFLSNWVETRRIYASIKSRARCHAG